MHKFKFAVVAAALLAAPLPVMALEIVDVPFTTPNGGVTTGLYSGQVKIKASGTGFSLGPRLNDAFYLLNPTGTDNSYYQLGFDTQPLVGFQPERSIFNFVEGGRPAFAADHVYNFVLNTGSMVPTKLYFGVTDGIYSDNGGSFRLEISQIGGVPEPTTWAMLILGFGVIGGAMRTRTRTRQSVKVAYA